MNALLAGRLCDIVRHVQRGDVATARNLIVNTPGVDWAQQLPPATYAALFGWVAPSGMPISDLVRQARERYPLPPARDLPGILTARPATAGLDRGGGALNDEG